MVDPMELVEVLNLSMEEVTFSMATGRPKPVPKLYPVVDGRVARYPISCGKRGSVLGTLISPGPGPRETPTRGVRRVRSNGVLQRAVTQNSVANGCIFPCCVRETESGAQTDELVERDSTHARKFSGLRMQKCVLFL